MRASLWPDDEATVAHEVGTYFDDGRIAGQPHAVFVAARGDAGPLAGFIEVSIHDAAASHTGGPVGFVEAWFVHERERRAGVGRALLGAGEAWCRAHGCVAMASDTREPWATVSVPVHIACGFSPVASTRPTDNVEFIKPIR